MKTEAGQMEIKADKKLVINVGTNINVTLNGSNGAVTVEGDKFNVKAGNGIVMESNAQAKLTGANISIEATSVLKANSNGTAVVKGMPLKLG